jgi:hypothetical protein
MTNGRELEAVLESALRLRNDPAFLPFINYLKTRREAARDRAETALDEAEVRRCQGRGQELRDVLNLIEEAPSRLEKVRGK